MKTYSETSAIGRVFKIFAFLMLMVGFLARSFYCRLLTKDEFRRRQMYLRNVHRYCRWTLQLFRVHVTVKNPPLTYKNHLIIVNHLGFLDDFIVAASIPTMFVTSVEMRETPLLGMVSEMAGCVYVEARDRSNIENEMKDIEAALDQGFNVVLYPEGKTTDGEMVHPFKKTLLMSCAKTKADLLPAVLNFKSVNGLPMQDKVRDLVFWYRKKPILKVLWNIAAIQSCEVDFEFLKEIPVSVESDRREIAQVAQTRVEEKYVKIPRPREREMSL